MTIIQKLYGLFILSVIAPVAITGFSNYQINNALTAASIANEAVSAGLETIIFTQLGFSLLIGAIVLVSGISLMRKLMAQIGGELSSA